MIDAGACCPGRQVLNKSILDFGHRIRALREPLNKSAVPFGREHRLESVFANGRNGQHIAVCPAQDFLGNAAQQQPSKAAGAAGAHDNEIR